MAYSSWLTSFEHGCGPRVSSWPLLYAVHAVSCCGWSNAWLRCYWLSVVCARHVLRRGTCGADIQLIYASICGIFWRQCRPHGRSVISPCSPNFLVLLLNLWWWNTYFKSTAAAQLEINSQWHGPDSTVVTQANCGLACQASNCFLCLAALSQPEEKKGLLTMGSTCFFGWEFFLALLHICE